MFDNASYQDWITQVQKYIKDQPLESYYHEIAPGIHFQPFAHADNTTERSSLEDSAIEYHIGVRFKENNAKAILDALMNGAQSIDLDIDQDEDIDALLKDVKLNYIMPIFRTEQDGLGRYLDRQYSQNSIKKAIFSNPIEQLNSVKNAYTLYPSSSNSDLDELVDLAQSFLNNPIKLPAFTIHLGKKFFLEIARLRAFRIIIANLKRYKNIEGQNIELITRIDNDVLEGDPDNALIAQTTVAMASIIGGATVSQLDPYTESKHQRISLNIQNILLLESHLSDHKDPMGGSYFMEDLTDKIANTIWGRLSF